MPTRLLPLPVVVLRKRPRPPWPPADSLSWLRRPAVFPEAPAEDFPRRGWTPALTTGTPLPQIEWLPWRRRAAQPDPPPPDEPRRPPGWHPGLTGAAAPPVVEQMPWARRPPAPTEALPEDAPRRAPGGLFAAVESLAWRRPPAAPAPPPPEESRPAGWGPALLTGTPLAQIEFLGWARRPRAEPPEPEALAPRGPPWGAIFGRQPAPPPAGLALRALVTVSRAGNWQAEVGRAAVGGRSVEVSRATIFRVEVV